MARLREYELVVVLSPALEEAKSAGAVERIHRFITERGGTLQKQESWGMKRLAYPLQRFNEGNYHFTQFTLDTAHLREMESTLELSEEVLRYLVVKAETKIVVKTG